MQPSMAKTIPPQIAARKALGHILRDLMHTKRTTRETKNLSSRVTSQKPIGWDLGDEVTDVKDGSGP